MFADSLESTDSQVKKPYIMHKTQFRLDCDLPPTRIQL
jgi:hypothetical protein